MTLLCNLVTPHRSFCPLAALAYHIDDGGVSGYLFIYSDICFVIVVNICFFLFLFGPYGLLSFNVLNHFNGFYKNMYSHFQINVYYLKYI